MTEETAQTNYGTLCWDREYWPNGGATEINGPLPYDLCDLWDKWPDQIDSLVAEAVINGDPFLAIHLYKDQPSIEVYLYSVGGDCITLSVNLAQVIKSAATDYDKIRGPAQLEDMQGRLAALEKIETAIAETRKIIQTQIDEYTKVTS